MLNHAILEDNIALPLCYDIDGTVNCEDDVFVQGGNGGCLHVHRADATVDTSRLHGCTASSGGAITAQSGSDIRLRSSNVTSSRTYVQQGSVAIFVYGLPHGRGAVAALHATNLVLQLAELRDNRAASDGHLFFFSAKNPEMSKLVTLNAEREANLNNEVINMNLAGGLLEQSHLKAEALNIFHHCASTSADGAALLAEGSRAFEELEP